MSRLRLPRRTVRLRLTVVYASLFLVSGAALLAITYVLVRQATGKVLVGTKPNGSTFVISQNKTKGAPAAKRPKNGRRGVAALNGQGDKRFTPQQLLAQARRDAALAKRQHEEELRLLLEQSGIALALMAAISILLGWLAAGRVLRPLRTLNDHAREISASDLHKRLALAGPDDELKQLAGTLDDLLDRLEASFAAQRQFVANASHELRTPLARARTLAEIALGDPDATVESLRASHRRVLAADAQQERLIEALLTLARSERGLDHREPVDIAAIAGSVLAAVQPEVERRGLHLRAELEPAEASGDARLAERLIANLVDNALRHNEAGGRVEVTTTTRDGRAVVSVSNTGPLVQADAVEQLFQPFRRGGTDRTDHSDGVGLGLSIVNAIAAAHEAPLAARPQPGGGLHIEVGFPLVGADTRDTSEEDRPARDGVLRYLRKSFGSRELATGAGLPTDSAGLAREGVDPALEVACLAGKERGVAEGVCQQSRALDTGEQRDREVPCVPAAELTELIL